MNEKWPFNDYAEQPQELLWLYTHCCAIGMKHKSDSGKLEHDIALFTAELCTLLEKAEDAMITARDAARCTDSWAYEALDEPLAAIKQWKEQT